MSKIAIHPADAIDQFPLAIEDLVCPPNGRDVGRGTQALIDASRGELADAEVTLTETYDDAMRMQKATNVVQNDNMLKRGKAISSAPIWIGRK